MMQTKEKRARGRPKGSKGKKSLMEVKLDQAISLLERIAYQLSGGTLEFEDYLKVVYAATAGRKVQSKNDQEGQEDTTGIRGQ